MGIFLALPFAAVAPAAHNYDVVIYGGAAAAVSAAVEVRRGGHSVAIVAPENHVGGISVDGLGSADINNHWFRNDYAVGGLAAEFYSRIGRKYGKTGPVYKYESHVAEAVFTAALRLARRIDSDFRNIKAVDRPYKFGKV